VAREHTIDWDKEASDIGVGDTQCSVAWQRGDAVRERMSGAKPWQVLGHTPLVGGER
jgi:hypothetical protein